MEVPQVIVPPAQALSERRREEIALKLCSKQTVASVDSLVRRLSEANGLSPILRVLGCANGTVPTEATDIATMALQSDEIAILYTVSGLYDANDDMVFPFDVAHQKDHALHCGLGRDMRYLVVCNDVEGNLSMYRCDCQASSAIMKTRSATKVAARASTSLARANDVTAALERGVTGIDAEGALGDCCAWLLESLQLVNVDFRNAIARSSESGASSIVEALMKRYTALTHVFGVVDDPSSAFTKLSSSFVPQGSPALQRWEQRKAHLNLVIEQSRVEAVWASMLSRHLVRLRIFDPARVQSLDTLNELLEPLVATISLVFVTCPRNEHLKGDISAGAITLAELLWQKLLPQLSFDLVVKCERLLQLTDAFRVEAVADAAEQEGYIMPLCTRDMFMTKFTQCAAFLRQYVAFYNSYATRVEMSMNFAPSMRTAKVSMDQHTSLSVNDTHGTLSASGAANASTAQEEVAVAAASYAADRCDDIVGFVQRIDKIGYGMMTPEVACLFETLSYAATRFPLLRAAEHKNWILLDKIFEKSATLKYNRVEQIQYEEPVPVSQSLLVDDSTLLNTTADGTAIDPSMISANGIDVSVISRTETPALNASAVTGLDTSSAANNTEVAMLREERAILSSRVTLLTEELAECRKLLASMQTQLEAANKGKETAQELNVVLMAEMRALYMTKAEPELDDEDRERLVKDIAEMEANNATPEDPNATSA